MNEKYKAYLNCKDKSRIQLTNEDLSNMKELIELLMNRLNDNNKIQSNSNMKSKFTEYTSILMKFIGYMSPIFYLIYRYINYLAIIALIFHMLFSWNVILAYYQIDIHMMMDYISNNYSNVINNTIKYKDKWLDYIIEKLSSLKMKTIIDNVNSINEASINKDNSIMDEDEESYNSIMDEDEDSYNSIKRSDYKDTTNSLDNTKSNKLFYILIATTIIGLGCFGYYLYCTSDLVYEFYLLHDLIDISKMEEISSPITDNFTIDEYFRLEGNTPNNSPLMIPTPTISPDTTPLPSDFIRDFS